MKSLMSYLIAFSEGKTVEIWTENPARWAPPNPTPFAAVPPVPLMVWIEPMSHDDIARGWVEGLDDLECDHVRIKPTVTPVDLSVLIASGIDCEFIDPNYGHTHIHINMLSHISGDHYYIDTTTLSYNKCKPRMNHWHAWNRGDCPLPEGLTFELRFRNGSVHESILGVNDIRWCYSKRDTAMDIIAFKVTGLADGYCWPWEVNGER